MEKLILLLILLHSFFIQSQEDYLAMSPEIEPIMEEYMKDAKDRGFYVRALVMERLDFIMFDDNLGVNGDTRLGITSPSNKLILLSKTLLKDKMLLKVAVYHELGHLLKNTGVHPCNKCYHIMSAYAPSLILPYYNEDFMKKRLDEYFKWLNEG